MGEVVFEHVSKVFQGGTIALDDLSLDVPDGQFMILVGPSGCGKTTALRCVAGLEKPTRGTIRVGDRVVNDVTPRDRDIAMVFQNYALYPHMSVYKNLAFGLRQRKTPKEEIDRRVSDVSTMLGLDELLKRRPAQLSGGQRQRVAMGRALVREPSAFLLDEPLSNLDAKLRVQMRAELKRLHNRLGITTIYVTHDQIEAMTLGDRIAVMSNGKLQQLGPPQELYDEPTNLFVAGFIGSPPMNLLRGRAQGGTLTAGELTIPRAGVPDGDVAIGMRPETFAATSDGLPSFEFLVDVVEPLGDEVVVHGSTAGNSVVTGAEEEEIPLMLEGARVPITARFDPGVRLSPGERLRLGVQPDRVHVFDLRTGLAIR
ncbi:MAG: ABC transporter ATP-binding protein [Planctomycetaceae bacterium]